MKDLSNYELKELIAMASQINLVHNQFSHVTDKSTNFNYALKEFTSKLDMEFTKRENAETI